MDTVEAPVVAGDWARLRTRRARYMHRVQATDGGTGAWLRSACTKPLRVQGKPKRLPAVVGSADHWTTDRGPGTGFPNCPHCAALQTPPLEVP